MRQERTSLFSNGLIWFGAAVSIAEILTGTYLAPLGFGKGLAAILTGHIIGCVLLFLAGVIGGKSEKSAMETVKLSFGQKGALLFAVMNVLQLIGWTGIMIVNGAGATAVVSKSLWGMDRKWIWCLAIGILIIVWILIGIRNMEKLNYAAMGALFILTFVLSIVIFRDIGAVVPTEGTLTFGAGVELGAAMPLSWLPLISDYTREAKAPVKASAVSAVVYFFASSWMYVIGMGAAIYTGESDIAAIMLKAGLGLAAVVILVISTVTTTFLDAYSAGVSSASISRIFRDKPAAVAVAVIGMVLAIWTPIGNIEGFLYLIGSVFAPMIAIQIADYFLLHKSSEKSPFNIQNLVIWAVGFILYRFAMGMDMPLGNTLPVMVITILLCVAVDKIFKK